MTIYDRAKAGEPIDLRTDEEYKRIFVPEMERSRSLCHQINMLDPYDEQVRKLLDELFEGRLPVSSKIMTPVYIDRGATIDIGENVFINWGFSAISPGSITIEDGVRLGPNVSVITANHDFHDLKIIRCKPVTIKKNAWLCEGTKILPGVTIGEGAVVGAGSIVTKDVAPRTVVAGNPARFIKNIE